MDTTRYAATRLGAAVLSTLALAACSTLPDSSPGADAARNRLAQLQADPQLARRAPEALRDAEAAVREAELPPRDSEQGAHRVVMAERRIDIARALAEARLAEDQRSQLAAQREGARLDARTREADVARDDATSARSDAEDARGDAELSRRQAETARADAARAEQANADAQARMDELEARPTDRGLVITLGDVLFSSGEAGLIAGVAPDLDKLAAFMEAYPERTATVEGHTDNVGRGDANLGLSQRRADSVKAYLVARGVSSSRIVASGMGEHAPIASNESANGRQQNRRVDIIINTAGDGRR
ncbi:OmpA family protein [Methyloversatilis sp. NSM2]|uniref:OmpA family protein n=1 Tax=Methyloversatilis sp. NSM2 TaxID=3134135 RepID=UPI003113CF80